MNARNARNRTHVTLFYIRKRGHQFRKRYFNVLSSRSWIDFRNSTYRRRILRHLRIRCALSFLFFLFFHACYGNRNTFVLHLQSFFVGFSSIVILRFFFSFLQCRSKSVDYLKNWNHLNRIVYIDWNTFAQLFIRYH